MGQVLIRNLDDALLDDYRRVAADRGHSLEAELREVLDRSRPKQRLSKPELLALAQQLQDQTPPDARSIDSTAFIREMRDKGYGFSG
jgi:plasmid stability protein